MRPYPRLSTVQAGPLGERMIALIETYFPGKNELYVTSAMDGDHGATSHHYGLFYVGSRTAAIDWGAYDDPEPNSKDQDDMRALSLWLYEHFWDLTVELIFTHPGDSHETYVKDQQRVGPYAAADHVNHLHWATSEALMGLIEARARALWGGGVPDGSNINQPPFGGPGNAHNFWIADLYDFTYDMGLRAIHVYQAVTSEGLWGLNAKGTEMASNGRWVHSRAMELLNVGIDSGVHSPMLFIVPRTGPRAIDQAEFFLETIDRAIPQWRTQHTTFQVDVEAWEYDRVSPELGVEIVHLLQDLSNKPAFLYASQGQYGNEIPTYPGRVLWNANYNGSGARRHFTNMYLGDSAPGWVHYSGAYPTLLQYCSDGLAGGWVPNTVQGGLAMTVFRGTPEEFSSLRQWALNPTGGPTMSNWDDKIGPYSAPDPSYAEHSFRTALAHTWARVNETRQVVNEINEKLDALSADTNPEVLNLLREIRSKFS